MGPVPEIRFSHLGIHVTDMAAMEAFYARFFGFAVTDRGTLETPRGPVDLVFLSRDPDEHHQFVLCSGRPPEAGFNVINQMSFRVAGIRELRRFHDALRGEPVSDIAPATHGNAVSVYFRDPEGNRIELYFPTPWYVTQPMRVALDFSLDDDVLMRHVEAHARSLPGFVPRETWQAEIAPRMRAAAQGARP